MISVTTQYNKVKTVLGKGNILVYTFFNYIDKGLAFLAPLGVLYFFNDKGTYNTIEYIFSIASIITIFLELGIKQYYFFGYKNSSDKIKSIAEIKDAFNFLLFIYTILFLILLFLTHIKILDFEILYFFIAIRALYLMLTGFLNYHFRLLDRPSLIFPITISVNLASIGLLFLGKFPGFSSHLLVLFFLFPTVLVLGSGLKNFSNLKTPNAINFLVLIKKSLRYSWPIIINVLLISFMNNYGKIYSYQFLSEDSMFQLSFALRISLVIHLAHASALGFLSKDIYMNSSKESFWRNFFTYSKILLPIFFIALCGLHMAKFLGFIADFNITLTTYIIFTYVLIWCYQSYFEIFFNKIGKTKNVLFYSSVAISTFFLCIYFLQINSIFKIATIMIFSVLINLFLLMFFGIRRRIFISNQA